MYCLILKKSLSPPKKLKLIIIQVDFLSIMQPLVFVFWGKKNPIHYLSINKSLTAQTLLDFANRWECKHFLNGSLIIQSKWCGHRASGDFLIHVLQANVLLISQPYRSINKSIRAISAALLRMYLLDLCCRSIKTSWLQRRNLFSFCIASFRRRWPWCVFPEKRITLGERRLETRSEIINHNYSITCRTVDSAASFFMWWCDITSEQPPPRAVQPGRHKETGRSSDGHTIVILKIVSVPSFVR